MKIKQLTRSDIYNMITAYPRTFADDQLVNLPDGELGCFYYLPSDASGTQKTIFKNWAWFSTEIFNSYTVEELIQYYNQLGGDMSLSAETGIAELATIDLINLIIGGTHPSARNCFKFERARLGAYANVRNHAWMWNIKLMDGELPYTDNIGNKTIEQYLIDLYNESTGSALSLVNE